MMEDVENGKIGVCIMKDLTRWGRDYLQAVSYTHLDVYKRQQQCLIFLYELALPQGNAVVLFQLFAQMLIHPPLQLFLNGHPQLSDISVGLPTDCLLYTS